MKKYVPRWLYSRKVVVPNDDYIELDANIFENDTIWPFHLEWMSAVSLDASPPEWGGACHQMGIAMAISGKGGLFPNPTSMSALFALAKAPRLGFAPDAMSPGAGLSSPLAHSQTTTLMATSRANISATRVLVISHAPRSAFGLCPVDIAVLWSADGECVHCSWGCGSAWRGRCRFHRWVGQKPLSSPEASPPRGPGGQAGVAVCLR